MEHEPKIGDTVRISERGKHNYLNSPNNPHHLEGKIATFTSSGRIRVTWSNGITNSYDLQELQLVEEKVNFRTFMRKLDAQNPLFKAPGVRKGSKAKPEYTFTGGTSTGLASAMGVSTLYYNYIADHGNQLSSES